VSSRNPYDLAPDTYLLYRQFEAGMKQAGIDYIVTCTYRSEAEQAVLFAQGRTAPGKIVTNAPPGRSAHNHTEAGRPAAKAFDIAIITAGKIDWDGSHPAWEAAGKVGESVGLEWAGRWHSFPEKPHFQSLHWEKQ
jgi:peptidoglycan L-alanyl-D-glutamate endopeptidase CwlK